MQILKPTDTPVSSHSILHMEYVQDMSTHKMFRANSSGNVDWVGSPLVAFWCIEGSSFDINPFAYCFGSFACRAEKRLPAPMLHFSLLILVIYSFRSNICTAVHNLFFRVSCLFVIKFLNERQAWNICIFSFPNTV